MKTSLEKKLVQDFSTYSQSEGDDIPHGVAEKILQDASRYLTPRGTVVFIKVFILHLIAGVFSLIVCDQFGIRPLDIGFTLSQYFMTFGHSVCMFLCGLVFLSTSMLVALVVLRQEEILVLKKNSWLFLLTLILFSLGFFLIFGADFVLSFTLLWIFGAFLGGFLPLLFVRRHFA